MTERFDQEAATATGALWATYAKDGAAGVSRLCTDAGIPHMAGALIRDCREDIAALKGEARAKGWTLQRAWQALRNSGVAEPDAAVIAAALLSAQN